MIDMEELGDEPLFVLCGGGAGFAGGDVVVGPLSWSLRGWLLFVAVFAAWYL